jgi:hypothetical protein
MVIGDDMRIRGNFTCHIGELAKRDNLEVKDILKIAKASSRQQVLRWFKGLDVPHALYLLRIKKATGWKLEDMIKEDESE